MLKKAYEFIIRQFQVKNRKDVLLLPLRLAAAYLIVRKIADDIRFFRCAWQTGDYETAVLYMMECALLCLLLFLLWKIMQYFKNKGKLKKAVTVFILFNLFTLLLNQSLSFVYYIDGPYIGRVMDAETGEPIRGAVVAGSWNMIYFESPWTGFGEAFADVHETMTDRFGWFVLPFGRKIWFWPFSVMDTAKIEVFASGYDSYPPSIYKVWDRREAKEWEDKLRKLYPNHRVWNSGTDISADAYGKSLYFTIFITNGYYRYIRLNKARSFKERKEVIRRMGPEGYRCRSARLHKAVREEKQRLESMALTE
ncbi:hypothetical protein DENIS_3253 [Desulfonema ishimotonii]|uniref:Uncharacterized protein n=1 Tax=Desulfonema ishimotonii TaxID=45657 RepID=A0A401FZ84_9BACT|nr:hypothetical protein [Desulfonema ishimotonii]GBC62275.1 hypothetical protein DENIS_3244 [Desulfonema ishimotonii]GBC62284.1 hypothetical protein DENIS_3253 [Desulfonema ishimotonii]